MLYQFRFEKRVAELFPSIFSTFNIKLHNLDSNSIMASLDRAMIKSHYKYNTLNLQFKQDLSPIHKELLMSYQDRIEALDIRIIGSEVFLIDPLMKFHLMESLSVEFHGNNELLNQKNITESLLLNHASKLKKLSVRKYWLIDNLNVPALPVLESLTMSYFNPNPAWSLFRATKQTLTSLDIRYIDMNTQPPINDAEENEAVSIYQAPNLQNLLLMGSMYTKILIHNANNLVSLTLCRVDLPSEVPELPLLRELFISWCHSNHSWLILSKCKESLKYIFLIHSSLDDHAITMPQLTDLFIIGKDLKFAKFISYNHKSLEFIYLEDAYSYYDMITLNESVKLERVKTVVIKFSDGGKRMPEEDKVRMAELCPNADILMWNKKNKDELEEFIIYRHKKNGFNSEVMQFLR